MCHTGFADWLLAGSGWNIVHHQESGTVYTAKGVCHTGFADWLLVGSGWNIVHHQESGTV